MKASVDPGADATVERAPAPTRYGPLAGLAWLHFVNDGAANFLPGVLPAVLIAVGKPASLGGTLLFVLLVGQVLQPLTGLLGPRLGGRRLMWVGVAAAAVGAGLVGFVPGFGSLLALLAAIGIANACFHPQALAAARRFAGLRGNFGMAIMMLGGEIGRGLWPLIASLAVAAGSLGNLWIPAACCLATLPIVRRFLPAPRVLRPDWRVRLAGRWAASARLLAYMAVRGLVVMTASAYLPILWTARGGDLVAGAALVTLMLLVGLAGALYGGHLADRIGRRPVLAGAGLAMAGALALVAWGATPAIWAGAALLGIPAFATFPITTVAGQDLFPENWAFGSGLALGFGNALGAGLTALAGLSLALVSLAGLFWILAAAALLTAVLTRIIPAPEHAPARV